MRNKEKFIGMLAVLLCASLLLGGTLAWSDFTQSRTNKFRGTTDPDVTLHDDFDGLNKDVYVENSGDQEIYVRVRLDEYMQVGGESFVSTADVKDKKTWTPHTYTSDPADIEDCGNVDTEHLFHRYYKWTMSGAQKGYTPGTPGLVSSKLDDDGNVMLTGSNQTLAANAPVTMAEYINVTAKAVENMTADERVIWDRIDAGCWILDSDGWAYWSRVLKPDTATNLLLDEVTLVRDPSDDWYYGIDVKLQAVTSNDFEKWGQSDYTKTPEADVLISHWNLYLSNA